MKSLDKRKDVRPTPKFKKDIGGRLETYLLWQVIDVFKSYGGRFTYEDTGACNDGSIIEDDSDVDLSKLDFRVDISYKGRNNVLNLDIEKNYKGYCGTIKIAKYNCYRKHNGVGLLAVNYDSENKCLHDDTDLYFFGEKTLYLIAQHIQLKQYPTMGNKWGYRLYKNHFLKFNMIPYKWRDRNSVNFCDWFYGQYDYHHKGQ